MKQERLVSEDVQSTLALRLIISSHPTGEALRSRRLLRGGFEVGSGAFRVRNHPLGKEVAAKPRSTRAAGAGHRSSLALDTLPPSTHAPSAVQDQPAIALSALPPARPQSRGDHLHSVLRAAAPGNSYVCSSHLTAAPLSSSRQHRPHCLFLSRANRMHHRLPWRGGQEETTETASERG